MDGVKPYILAIVVQVMYTGMFVIFKATFNHGMNTFVFVFYRQAAASLLLLPVAILFERKNARSMTLGLLLKLFFYSLFGITFSSNVQNLGIKFTSGTVAAAIDNSMPVATFCLALLLRMETVKLRSSSGVAKVTGVALCIAGTFVLAFYTGPSLSPLLSLHRSFAASRSSASAPNQGEAWILGTFFHVASVVAWSLWIVLQTALLKDYPNKMLVTAAQCVFSAVQAFIVAVVAERDFSMWKLQPDVTLLSILYSGFVVTGVSYYLQAWCVEMRGPVFLAAWAPLCFILTMCVSYFFIGEAVHLGSILGGILLCGGLFSMLWGKSKETNVAAANEMSSPLLPEHSLGNVPIAMAAEDTKFRSQKTKN